MAHLTISEAIKRSPIGKSQFYSKYIDGGLITVSVNSVGKKYIDSSELLRVFGELKSDLSDNVRKNSDSSEKKQAITNDNGQDEIIKLLKSQLSEAKSEANKREEYYQSQIISLTSRLEGPKYRSNPFIRWWRGLGKED